jgi:ribosomal protein L40E
MKYLFDNQFLLISTDKLHYADVHCFFLIRFAIKKVRRYSEDGPFSNRLFCHHCNTENFPYEKVCKKCGQKFQMEFYILCQGCNARVSKTVQSCLKCGAEIKLQNG